MKHKLSRITLSLLFAGSLMACSSSSSTPKEITANSSSNSSETSTNAEEVTIQADQVLVDQNGLKITTTALVNDSFWGKGIEVLIENDSTQNLNVSCRDLIVNNYMITDLFSSSVAAGKKANETIYLYSHNLEAAGIDTISEVDLSFHVSDGDSYTSLFDTDEIQIQTSAYGTIEQPALDDGTELLNQNGVRIVGKYVDESSFWGAGILLYLENNSGNDIVVQSDNMSINGFMVTPFFSSQVNNTRMAIDTITIMSSDLEDNHIESVEEIELTFRIIDANSYQTLFNSDPVTFSTN